MEEGMASSKPLKRIGFLIVMCLVSSETRCLACNMNIKPCMWKCCPRECIRDSDENTYKRLIRSNARWVSVERFLLEQSHQSTVTHLFLNMARWFVSLFKPPLLTCSYHWIWNLSTTVTDCWFLFPSLQICAISLPLRCHFSSTCYVRKTSFNPLYPRLAILCIFHQRISWCFTLTN